MSAPTWPVPVAGENFVEEIWDTKSQTVRPDFGLLRLPFRYSRDEIAKTVKDLLPDSAWTPKYGIRGYDVAGLTASDPTDLYGDEKKPQAEYGAGNKLIRLIPVEPRVHSTPAFDALAPLWQKFADYSIIKPKLLRLKSASGIRNHIDGPEVVNFHVAVQTNELAICCVLGKLYRIPADGYVYALNASIPHHVFNYGANDRIHLVFAARPERFESQTSMASEGAARLDRARWVRDVQHRLTKDLLRDGGEALYRSLAADLAADDVRRFSFVVPQSTVDDQSFPLLLGLVVGIVLGADRAIDLKHESETGVLRVTPENRSAFEYLRYVMGSPVASEAFRNSLKDFFARVDMVG